MRVMIVDDEYLQRELVRHSVDWDKLGLKICAEAEDGNQVLELVNKVKPDIIIMDINIPFVNGLEVSRIIKEKEPDIQILILTAYGEFEYAREALRFGAVSFVLKPLDGAELEQELIKAKNSIQRIQSEKEYRQELEMDNFQKEKEQFLLEMTAGLSGQAELEKRCERYGICSREPFYLMVLRYQNSEGYEQMAEEQKEVIAERFPDLASFSVETDYIYVLFQSFSHEEYQVRIKSLCSFLEQELDGRHEIYGGVSELHEDIREIHLAYQEAYLASGTSAGKIVHYEPENVTEAAGQAARWREKFLYELRSKKFSGALEVIRQYFELIQKYSYSGQSTAYLITAVLMEFATYLMEMGIDVSAELARLQRKLSTLPVQKVKEPIYEEVEEFLQKGITMLQERIIPSGQKKMEEAKQFIDEYYDSANLSLNMVAERIGVNPSYLSNIFKRECGFALSRYIITVRLREAKRRMEEQPYITVTEVAEKVGYTDVYYFSKSFKKFYGVSPSQYLSERML
ncbi:MAG: response regulator [Ruminococcus sp.]|nr:response regulator [Ruminococcus sp.]